MKYNMFVLRPLLFPIGGGGTRASNSFCKTERADFTDRMSFLASKLKEKISPNIEALSVNALKAFHHHGNVEKTNALIKLIT